MSFGTSFARLLAILPRFEGQNAGLKIGGFFSGKWHKKKLLKETNILTLGLKSAARLLKHTPTKCRSQTPPCARHCFLWNEFDSVFKIPNVTKNPKDRKSRSRSIPWRARTNEPHFNHKPLYKVCNTKKMDWKVPQTVQHFPVSIAFCCPRNDVTKKIEKKPRRCTSWRRDCSNIFVTRQFCARNFSADFSRYLLSVSSFQFAVSM